jgi:hypothetical protein
LEKLWAVAARRIEGLEDVMTHIIRSAGNTASESPEPRSSQDQSVAGKPLTAGGAEDLLERWNDDRVEEYLHELYLHQSLAMRGAIDENVNETKWTMPS